MAKLPCPPQSRIYTLKDTGETMSYDQVREYLMSNPELWSGAKEGKKETKTENDKNIDFVFESHPQLSRIGTKQQYAEYLKTIFPKSRVKDIVYHGSKTKKPTDIFVETFIGKNHKILGVGKGFYFTKDFNYSKIFGETTFSIINIEKPTDFNSNDYDTAEELEIATRELSSKGDGVIDSRENFYYPKGEENLKLSSSPDYVVFKPEQIHILGGEKDIQGFKNFVANTKSTTTTETKPSEKGEQEAGPLSSVEATAKALEQAVENNPAEFIERLDGRVELVGGIIKLQLAAQKGDKKNSVIAPSKIPFLPSKITLTHLAKSKADKNGILKDGFDIKRVNIDSPIPGIYFSGEDWSTMGRFGRSKENALFVEIENDGLLYFDSSSDFRKYLKENKLPYQGETLSKEQLEFLKGKGVKGILLREDFASQSKNELIIIDDSIIKNISESEKPITKLPSSFSEPNSISEAYHAAKKDGSNPELVKAVEGLLGEKAEGKPLKKGQLLLKDGRVVTPTDIDGQTTFYHGSTKPRKGRLRANWAEGFGEAVYFGTDKRAIEEDYEDQYTTTAQLNLKKPLYYNNKKEWDAVVERAVELYSRKETPKLLDEYSKVVNGVREWYDEDAQAEYEAKGYIEPRSAESWVKEEDASWINKAAQELGYDAIIAPHHSFGNEIAVLDENAIIYPEEIETEGKEATMPKAPYVQEVIPPINEEQAAGEKEVEALKKGDKITTTNPMRLLKGIYGKRNADGSIRSAHTGVNGIFSSITEKIARRYEGEEGVVVFEIPAGVTVETVKVVQSPESKGVAVSAVRQMETDAINASDAQVVKLITMDSRGEESQYIIKDPALRKIGYKPSERKPLTPEQELKQAFDKWKSETGKLGIVPNWERQAKADIEFFKAAKKYLLTKIGQGAYAFEQFLKDLAKAKVENIDEDRSKWKKFYNDTIKEAAPAEEGKTATPPPPVTPPAAGRGEGEGETKERKTITSIKGLEDISEQVKEALFGETTRYTVLPNQVSLNEANAILNAMGEEKAKALVLNGSEDIPDAFRVTLGEVLIKKFNSEGKYNDAVDVATGVAREATGWGQAIQALSLIKFLTPEGQLLAATRTINAHRDKRFKAEEGKMKRVKKAFEKADTEAIEGAINAVVAQTEETPAPQATRAKTWGEKNKIVTKAVYEAAKKALKKFAFTGVPPELITIAAYHVEAGARSFADFSKEMVKDFGRKVRPYLRAAYKAAQKKVGGTGYSTDKEIAAHLATTLDKDIKEVMKESGIQIRDLIRQHLSEAERTKEAITKALVDKLGLRKSDAAMIAAKVEAEYNRLATEKKTKALKAIERRLLRKSPVRKKAEEKLIELSNLGAFKEDKFKEEYARAMGFPEITKENAAKIEELANKVQNAKEGRPKFNAIIELLNYQASLPGVDKMDLATSVWMASLLSGPTTQLKNIFANSYNMGALALNVAAQSPKDIPFLLRGLTIGLGNGLQEGGSTMITGQSPIKQSAAAQGVLERAKFSPYNPFGYYKFVPRFMLAADAVTYGALKEMRAYQLALSEARDKYPTEKAVQKAIDILAQTDAQLQAAQAEAEQEYQEALAEIESDKSLNKVQKEAKKLAAKLDRSRRVYDIVEQNRPNQLVKEAHDFALRGTFNNPPDGALGMAARFFNGITHKVPAVRFFVPFVNVITNVANEYVNYSPVGYARAMKGGSITGNRKTFTERDRKELMIKATIGTTAAIAAYVLSGIGAGGEDDEEPMFEITADGYNDYTKNKELELTGWRPYSIRVGDTWVSYKLTPMAAMLAAVGALRDREKYGKEKLSESALNKLVIPFQEFMSTVAETSFLGSAETFLSGVLGATKGDKGQKLVEWATKTGGAAVPILGTNLYQQIAQKTYDALDIPDKEYRGADGAIGMFAKTLRNVPVIRDEFQNAVNGLGEELPPQTGGVVFSKKEAGPYAKLWQLLADKKATTGRPDRRGAAYIDINGDEKAMNDEQFYFFAKTRGEYIRTLMEVNYDRLKEMDEKEFAKWMNEARDGANKWAFGELVKRDEGGIYEKGIKKFKAEAEHEKARLKYALERGDAEGVEAAFENYHPFSQNTATEDKRKIYSELLTDDIIPDGIHKDDKVNFYKGIFLDGNPKIRVQDKMEDGKVRTVSKYFDEVFTEKEKQELKDAYIKKEEELAEKLEVLDESIKVSYTKEMRDKATWRKYLKMANE